jgi:hypothetical protein
VSEPITYGTSSREEACGTSLALDRNDYVGLFGLEVRIHASATIRTDCLDKVHQVPFAVDEGGRDCSGEVASPTSRASFLPFDNPPSESYGGTASARI